MVAFQNCNRAEASLVEARHRLASERLARARQAETRIDWNGALSLYRAALEAEDSPQARWGIGLLVAYEAPTDVLQVLDAGHASIAAGW